MKRFAHSLVPIFCAALLTFVATSTRAQDSDVSEHPMIGDAAPPFELKSITGDTLSLKGWRGEFLVVHFGASW